MRRSAVLPFSGFLRVRGLRMQIHVNRLSNFLQSYFLVKAYRYNRTVYWIRLLYVQLLNLLNYLKNAVFFLYRALVQLRNRWLYYEDSNNIKKYKIFINA